MLSFASTLASQLKNANPVSFWVLKLYYNDESAFIGVSDQDRVDGSDVYHGLVSSWGTLSQSMNFFTFKTNSLNMSVKLINTEHSIQGGRFSDLLAAKNFANRKWELHQVSSGYSTWDATANLIGSGIISGNINYNTTFVGFTLLDYSSKKHKKIPASTVTSASYPNAPEKNLNKPIPMAYGDFHEKTDIGTIPTTYFHKFKQFYKSAYPAIITDKFDVGEAAIEAHVDTQAMHTLDNSNVYYYKSGSYATITGTVDATTNNPRIEFSGARCQVYHPLSTSGFTDAGTGTHSNEANISSLDFSDTHTYINVQSGNHVTVRYALPQVNKLGEYVAVSSLTKFGTVSGALNAGGAGGSFLVGAQTYTAGSVVTDAELLKGISGAFSGDAASWNYEGTLDYKLLSISGAKTVNIVESGVVIEFDIDAVESHKTTEMIEVTEKTYGDVIIETQFETEREVFYEDKVVPRTVTHTVPSEVDYVYCSGKGRKYGTWIDSFDGDPRTDLNGGEPDPNYAANACIENPVYIIEDILRTELSLGAADDHEIDIDIQTFDKAGNAQSGITKGDIGFALNDDVDEILFAFSQPKFIGSKDLIERIGRQICSWVWISANGLFKIRTLLRPGDTWAEDKVVDYRDITLKSISRSPIDAVRNSVITNYNYDHGESQFKSQTSAATDSGSNSSQSSDVEGFNQVLKLEIDTDTLDSTTAGNIRAAHLNMFKDRKVILDFDCHRPVYNDLEITDIIKFENWDSKIKIYGTAMGTDYYMITNISKTPFGCSIKAIKVSS